ncbi:MAG: ATPase P [Chloroflexota bacterium]
MLHLEVPGLRTLYLHHLVLDVNGTLALDGELLPGVRERLHRLRQQLTVHLVTADTHGRQEQIDRLLGLTAVRLVPGQPEAEQKAAFIRALGDEGVVAIGNGANDTLMFRKATLAIAVLGTEGLAVVALREADVLVPDIMTALDLLLHPRRLIATLRR